MPEPRPLEGCTSGSPCPEAQRVPPDDRLPGREPLPGGPPLLRQLPSGTGISRSRLGSTGFSCRRLVEHQSAFLSQRLACRCHRNLIVRICRHQSIFVYRQPTARILVAVLFEPFPLSSE